jgi:putative addiction module antidote
MAEIYIRKLRKYGNSKVLTVPDEVIQALNADVGQEIAFVMSNGTVRLEAASTDILNIANEVADQYNNALNDLVNR